MLYFFLGVVGHVAIACVLLLIALIALLFGSCLCASRHVRCRALRPSLNGYVGKNAKPKSEESVVSPMSRRRQLSLSVDEKSRGLGSLPKQPIRSLSSATGTVRTYL